MYMLFPGGRFDIINTYTAAAGEFEQIPLRLDARARNTSEDTHIIDGPTIYTHI
jgi:hypothetical protein